MFKKDPAQDQTQTRIVFYGYAPTPGKDRIGLLRIVKEQGQPIAQTWTGATFPNTRKGVKDAELEVGAMNDAIARHRAEAFPVVSIVGGGAL